jgi:uncharacterized Rmd1/YagE family protein
VPSLSVDAYGFAATFKLRELLPLFAGLAAETRMKERLLAVFRDDAGVESYALCYDFGAVVFVGVAVEQQKALIDALRRRIPEEPHPPLTESFLIETGGAGTIEVRFDRVVVKTLTVEIVDIVALILAQSVAMDYYARDVEEIEVETDRIADGLRRTGRVPGRVRSLVQFIGLCIATRNDVISTLALFDKPDATWENEELDRLWNNLYHMLELDDRYQALEAKLRMFQDNLLVLVDLTRQRANLFLEATIVILIVLEILITVWQLATGGARA